MPLPGGKKMHLLPATLETTQWGWFDNAQEPVLRVNSGDTVVLETMMHSHNQVVPGTTIEQIKKLRTDFPGRGPHTVTGPIYIEEAQPGDVLKVTLNKIVPRAYATNFNVPGHVRPVPEHLSGRPSQISVSRPRQEDGRILARRHSPGPAIPRAQSVSPARSRDDTARCRRANMPATWTSVISSKARRSTCRCMFRARCLWTGDSHAGQGNGEVNLTAIETAYKEFNITVEVIKGRPLDFPRIETPSSWITMGFDQDLNKAWDQAKAETVKFLSRTAQRFGRAGRNAHDHACPTVASRRSSTSRRASIASTRRIRTRSEDMERPTQETPTYLVTHVQATPSLNKAMNDASMAMIKLLENEKRIARLDAYGLASVAMDCRVGAVSDTAKNIHCLIPKSIWQAPR